MKNATEILNHLKLNPSYKQINTNHKINQVIKSLPISLKNAVSFSYEKNNILFFVLTHQQFRNEFDNNKDLIKSLLKMVNINNILEIKTFVTNKPTISVDKAIILNPNIQYKRKSYAIFDNFALDNKIHKKFEEIREIIKESINKKRV